MKQENRFAAELQHYLLPFIDLEKDFFFCLEGAAAKSEALKQGTSLLDDVLPDFWFSVYGREEPVGVEAKILDSLSTMSFRQSQIQEWRRKGEGGHSPDLWVAANVAMNEFYCWDHKVMQNGWATQ